MKMASKSMIAYTMVTGAANEQGQVTSQVTYEQATGEIGWTRDERVSA